mgnify:CR=1 FL=1
MVVQRFYRYTMFFYLYVYFSGFNSMMPFWALFLSNKYNYSSQNIILFFSFFSFTVFLLELPAGLITDRLGAKKSSAVGIMLKAVSLLILLFSDNFLTPFISQIIVGTGEAFCSGSRDALAYRYYLMQHDKSNFHTFNAKVNSINWIGILTSFICASFASYVSLNSILICSFSAYLLASISVLFVKIHESDEEIYSNNSIQQIKDITRTLIKDKNLGMLLVFTSVIQALLCAMFTLFQPLLNELDIADMTNGFLYAFVTLFAVIGSLVQPFIRKKVDDDFKQLAIVSIFMISICLIVAFAKLNLFKLIILFAVFRFVFGYSGPAISSMLNLSIQKENMRASIFSIQSLALNLFQSIVLLLLQALDISTSTRYCFIFAFIIVFMLMIWRIRKNEHKVE